MNFIASRRTTTMTPVINANTTIIRGELTDDYEISYFLIVVFILVFIIGVTGNFLVLYLFKFENPHRLSTMECLICFLALADFLASIINPAMFIYWTVTRHRVWHFGSAGCLILPGLTRITVTYSFGMISVITIDRWRVICHPSKCQLKPHLTWLVALIVLFLSILTELPKMTHVNVKVGRGCDVNDNQTSENYIYPRVIILILRNILFILVFLITIHFIYKELQGKEKISTLRDQINLKRVKRIVWLLITMAIIFIILVFPRELFLITFESSYLSPPGIKATRTIQYINSALKVLHMCNCICNPFIYAKLHSQFKRDLRSMIQCMKHSKGKEIHEDMISLSSGNYVVINETQKMNDYVVKNEKEVSTPQFALTRYKDRVGRKTHSRHTTYDTINLL